MPRITRPVGFALLEKRVSALLSFCGSVPQSGGLTSEHLLADEAVVDHVERELEHPDCGWRLLHDLGSPIKGDVFQIFMSDRTVGHTHVDRLICRVVATEEEDFPCAFLSDHACQVGRAVARVVTRHVRVGLLEDSMFATRQSDVTDDVQTVASSDGPPWDERYHHFWHESYEALDFEDVESAQAGLVTVLVSVLAPDSLIAT